MWKLTKLNWICSKLPNYIVNCGSVGSQPDLHEQRMLYSNYNRVDDIKKAPLYLWFSYDKYTYPWQRDVCFTLGLHCVPTQHQSKIYKNDEANARHGLELFKPLNTRQSIHCLHCLKWRHGVGIRLLAWNLFFPGQQLTLAWRGCNAMFSKQPTPIHVLLIKHQARCYRRSSTRYHVQLLGISSLIYIDINFVYFWPVISVDDCHPTIGVNDWLVSSYDCLHSTYIYIYIYICLNSNDRNANTQLHFTECHTTHDHVIFSDEKRDAAPEQ